MASSSASPLSDNTRRSVAADNTASKQRGRPFPPGQSGNPSGRPRGARSKLSEVLLSAVVDDFAKHGAGTIEKVRETDPTTYLKIVCALVPREMLLKHEQEPPLDFTCPDFELMSELLEAERIKAGWTRAVESACRPSTLADYLRPNPMSKERD